MENRSPLVFAHIGDLHITKSGEQNYKDLLSILAQIEAECRDQIDFIYIPGDLADNGLPAQYNLISTALRLSSRPVHLIAGDHDMEQGTLENFYKFLPARQLPYATNVKGVKCIFLDVCGYGKGGPDFRLGEWQLNWLRAELTKDKCRTAIFMHTYPDDLVDEAEKKELVKLIAEHNILLVEMGHTHYNDISNDGNTVFAAVRSTGQIEEGPVGYSLVSIDEENISWRFKALDEPFPFPMITAPSDKRLSRDLNSSKKEESIVSAVVFGHLAQKTVQYVTYESSKNMLFNEEGMKWYVDVSGAGSLKELTVMATDASGRPGLHTIRPQNERSVSKVRVKDGSDKDSIGAWPENGIAGTQLGPNRNAKPSKY